MNNNEKNSESLSKVVINCLITIYLTPSTKPYFIRDYENLDDAYFI